MIRWAEAHLMLGICGGIFHFNFKTLNICFQIKGVVQKTMTGKVSSSRQNFWIENAPPLRTLEMKCVHNACYHHCVPPSLKAAKNVSSSLTSCDPPFLINASMVLQNTLAKTRNVHLKGIEIRNRINKL